MEDTSYWKEKFNSLATSFNISLECPICIETVKTPFKLCMTGHAVCLECTSKFEKCPLCQGLYVLENPICVRNILEDLPPFCCYRDRGCQEIVEPGNDHERFCGYRPIICRVTNCSVSVSVNEILKHYETRHPDWYKVIIRRQDFPLNQSWKLGLKKNWDRYTPVYLFDNFFWVLMVHDISNKQLKIYFQAAPIGKLKHDYYARITFEKNNFIYTYTLKASLLSYCEEKLQWKEDDTLDDTLLCNEEFCMTIPQCQLSHFINDDGKLSYKYFFFRM